MSRSRKKSKAVVDAMNRKMKPQARRKYRRSAKDVLRWAQYIEDFPVRNEVMNQWDICDYRGLCGGSACCEACCKPEELRHQCTMK